MTKRAAGQEGNRTAQGEEYVVGLLRACRVLPVAIEDFSVNHGTQFDPAVVAAFLEVPRPDLEAVAVRWRDAAEATPFTGHPAASSDTVAGFS